MKTTDLIKNGKQYYYKLNSKSKALECFTEVLKIDNNNLEAYVNKANLLIDLHYPAEGLEFINKALKINPHYIDSYFVKSKALASMGDIQEATKWCDYGTDFYIQYERNAESYFVQAEALEAIRQQTPLSKNAEIEMQEHIVGCYSMVLKIDPSFAGAYKAKSQALINMDKYEEAIKCCSDGLNFKAYQSELYSDIGRCLYAMNNYKEALLYFDICISIDPKEAKYNYYKGLCLNKTHKHKEAIQSFNKYIDLKSQEDMHPDDAEGIAILNSLTEEKQFASEWVIDPDDNNGALEVAGDVIIDALNLG